jgi:hypothetical protein
MTGTPDKTPPCFSLNRRAAWFITYAVAADISNTKLFHFAGGKKQQSTVNTKDDPACLLDETKPCESLLNDTCMVYIHLFIHSRQSSAPIVALDRFDAILSGVRKNNAVCEAVLG